MRRQLFLGIENSPLDGADGNGLSRRDLVVFPILDKPQHHGFPFLYVEKLHPIPEFPGRDRIAVRRGKNVSHVRQVDRGNLACALNEVPAGGVAGHLEKPGAKQSVIPKLSGLSVNREHDVLGKVFGNTFFVPAPAEEGKQLGREYSKQIVKRGLVGLFQESFRYIALVRIRHRFLPFGVPSDLDAHYSNLQDSRAEDITGSESFAVPRREHCGVTPKGDLLLLPTGERQEFPRARLPGGQ